MGAIRRADCVSEREQNSTSTIVDRWATQNSKPPGRLRVGLPPAPRPSLLPKAFAVGFASLNPLEHGAGRYALASLPPLGQRFRGKFGV